MNTEPPTPASPADGSDLSAALWREREALDLLLYKLETQQLLLSAGRTEWLAAASGELEAAISLLRAAGVERSIAAQERASAWGVPADADLRQIVAAAPDTLWRELLGEHLAAMAGLTDRVTRTRDANLALLRTAERSIVTALESISFVEEPGLYRADGRADDTTTAARLVDRDL
jgi:hypothetical protein